MVDIKYYYNPSDYISAIKVMDVVRISTVSTLCGKFKLTDTGKKL